MGTKETVVETSLGEEGMKQVVAAARDAEPEAPAADKPTTPPPGQPDGMYNG